MKYLSWTFEFAFGFLFGTQLYRWIHRSEPLGVIDLMVIALCIIGVISHYHRWHLQRE